MATWIAFFLGLGVWALFGWSGTGFLVALVVAFIAEAIVKKIKKQKQNDEFFEFSETTCNRCGATLQAHSRVGARAYYTCHNCHRSFTQKLYDPN